MGSVQVRWTDSTTIHIQQGLSALARKSTKDYTIYGTDIIVLDRYDAVKAFGGITPACTSDSVLTCMQLTVLQHMQTFQRDKCLWLGKRYRVGG